MDLGRFFKDNIDYVNGVISLHKGGLEHGVILSNLYLHLADLPNVTNENIKSYIVTYCSRIRRWNKRAKNSELNRIKDCNEIVTTTTTTTINIDFEQKLYDFCDGLTYIDRCTLLDYYANKNLISIEDYQRFFKVKRRTAFEIKKKIETLNAQLFNYINNQLC